jgi:hypothetical protein
LFANGERGSLLVADRLGAGEHHDEAVDAEADAAGAGHAVFEGEEEFLVQALDFLADLVFQTLALDDRGRSARSNPGRFPGR